MGDMTEKRGTEESEKIWKERDRVGVRKYGKRGTEWCEKIWKERDRGE